MLAPPYTLVQVGEIRRLQFKYDDEDVQAVVGIFQTLADSVKAQQGKWQCIVLDHARNEIYGEIEEVHEVDIWRDGKKLIPTYWYE